jgi:hypothetical protein
MKSSVREFAREIYSSEGVLDLYDLHVKYRLSPSELVRIAALFVRLGLVEQDGMCVRRTPGARRWIWERRQRFFLDEERPWARLNREGRDPAQPYMPSLAHVNEAFFRRLAADDDDQ